MEQSIRMPVSGPALSQAVTPAYLQQLLQLIEMNMPVDEVVHALHAEATMDPEIRNHPAMERFSDVGVTNLHAKVAAAGFIRRMMSGDRSEAVLTGLKNQLGVMVRTHADAKSAFTRLMSDAEARKNPAVQSLSQVMGLADQVAATLRPYVTPLVAPEVFTDAH